MLEKGKINGWQLAFLIFCFTIATSVMFLPAKPAKNLAWLAVIYGMAEGLLFLAVLVALVKRFPGKTLVEINETVFGRIAGKAISLLYIWFFIHVASLHLRTAGDFFTTLYPETPMLVFLAWFILVSVSAARNGIEVIARCSQIIVPFVLFLYVSDDILLLKDADFTRLLPIFGDVSLLDFLQAGHAINAILFGETVVFLVVFAYLNNNSGVTRYSSLAFILAALAVSISAARNQAVLGNLMSIATYPTYMAVRVINIGEILTRLEILVVIGFIFISFIKLSLLQYSASLSLAQVFGLTTYLPLVLPLAAIITCLGFMNFQSHVEGITFAGKYYPYYALPFELFLPLFTLGLAIIKGKGQAKGEQSH